VATQIDYYEVLEITKTASNVEISKAYRKLAIKFHPDSHPDDEEATQKFKQAAEAYEVLGDETKRARYDQYGHAGLGQGGGGGGHFNDVEDIFDAFGDIFGGGVFGDLFGGRGGGGRRHGGPRVRKGGDIKVRVTLDLEEAAAGVDKELEFDRHEHCGTCKGSGAKPGSSPEKCTRCGGHGQVIQQSGILRVQTTCPSCGGAGTMITDPCGDCHGVGTNKKRISIEVAIPAGIDDGMRVRITGEGQPSPDGGPAGDCYCFISLRKHKLFEREGDHLILKMPITYSQATLGASIEVPTLTGMTDLEITKGSPSGEVFKIRGKGMPDPHGRGQGDLYIQTYIEVPKKLEARQEELLRELADIEHTHVSPHRKTFMESIRGLFASEEEQKESK
jgi:molecular chaperone DnaJ